MADQLGSGWGQPKVSKIESGRQLPTEDDIRAWASLTGADIEELLRLHQRATHEFETFRAAYAEDGPVGHQASYAAAERAARSLFFYQPLVVHAWLQTPEYARAILNLPGGPADHGGSADQIDGMIAERMRRSTLLYEPGRSMTVIIGEAALRNQVGPPDLMQHQREHIGRLIKAVTHARIGIIPFERCPILPLHGWEQRDGIVSIETTAGDLEIADPAEVRQYEAWAERLTDAAIFDDSVVYIAR